MTLDPFTVAADILDAPRYDQAGTIRHPRTKRLVRRAALRALHWTQGSAPRKGQR